MKQIFPVVGISLLIVFGVLVLAQVLLPPLLF